MSTKLSDLDLAVDMAIDIMCHSPELVNKIDNDIRPAVHNYTTAPAEWYEDFIQDLALNESHQRAHLAESILRNRMAIALLELFVERLVDENELMADLFDHVAKGS